MLATSVSYHRGFNMKQNHLNNKVLIHVCKDKTLSYRTRDEPIFNGVALPVFSVPTKDNAESLIVCVGRAQYVSHPLMPGKVWYKITLDGELDFKRYLDIDDLPAVTEKLSNTWEKIKTHIK